MSENVARNSGPAVRPEELRAYYSDPAVVDAYLRRRTAQPLNGVLHARQVQFINEVFGARAPQRVLEVAPGPARLTVHFNFSGRGVAVDFSPDMLVAARRRLQNNAARWAVVRGDAFSLPVPTGTIDLAIAIRFVRRFQLEERQRLYAEIRRTLRPGAALIVDAQNRAVSQPHRESKGLDTYPVYDQLYSPGELVAELETAGFRVRRMEGMIRHFALQSRLNRMRRIGLGWLARPLIGITEWVPSDNPSTWMVLAEPIG